MCDVIILHNNFSEPSGDLYLSQSGVMEQVAAVGGALEELGIRYEIAAIDDIKDLTSLLCSCSGNIIFNLAEEFAGSIEQACYVPAVCDAFGKSCTGNDTPALLLCQNKANTKSILRSAGIHCPDGAVVGEGQTELIKTLKAGRYIIKPALCDAGEGISCQSVVDLPDEYERAAELIKQLYTRFEMPLIIERFIPQREINVAMMQCAGQLRILAAAEIDFSAFPENMAKIVDYSAKWEENSFGYNNTPRKLPAPLSEQQYQEVCRMSIGAWEAMGCRDYARIDFRIDEQAASYVIEVNPNPDISPDSGFAAALDYANVSYAQFVQTMINNASQRRKDRKITK